MRETHRRPYPQHAGRPSVPILHIDILLLPTRNFHWQLRRVVRKPLFSNDKPYHVSYGSYRTSMSMARAISQVRWVRTAGALPLLTFWLY